MATENRQEKWICGGAGVDCGYLARRKSGYPWLELGQV